jgi:DnaJ homolog subfamily C member 19
MKLLFLIIGAGLLWWLWQNSKSRTRSMGRAQAAKLLGIAENADPATILEAHKRLISRVHPDAGGSAELAAQINRARDILLSQITQ